MVESSIHFFTQRNVTFIHKNAPEKTQETASKKAPHAQRFLHSIPVPLQAGCEEMAGHGIASRSAP